jgi:hypothetical protein
MPTPEQEREMIRALRRMGDKLVQLGYAKRIVFEDTPKVVTILWSPAGRKLKLEMQRIFDTVAKGGGEINVLEIKALFALFLQTNDPEQTGGQHR